MTYLNKISVLVCVFIPVSIFAQDLTLTSPSSPLVVAEGDEFSRDVLLNAWDFDQRRDFGWEEDMEESSISVQNGIWSGNTAKAGAYVFPLFPGLKGTLLAEGSSVSSKLPKFGINHRIDSSKYSWLSFQANFSSRTAIALYWDSDVSRPEYWPDSNSSFGLVNDGFYDHNIYFRNSGWFNYSLDLSNLPASTVDHGGAWSAEPYVFRIDPSVFTASGSNYQFDWIRLSDPNSAPLLSLSWTTLGVPADAVLFICYLKDGSSGESTPVYHILNKNMSGSFNLPLASLPPGKYNFFVEMRRTAGSSYTGEFLRGNFSPDIEIQPRATIEIVSPSKTSGEEYSQSIGNVWDMNSSDEILNLNLSSYSQVFRQFFNQSFTTSVDSTDGGSIFQAVAEAPIDGNSETDAQIHLGVSKTKQIDTSEFIYLNYRVAIDPFLYGNISDKVSNGWVMRPVWWKGDLPKIFNTAKAHIVYEGWHDYVVDLVDPDTLETGIRWDQFRFLDNLRLDPLETTAPTWFYFDYVRLFAKNRSISGQYQIKYKLQSSDSSTVELYYDFNDSGFDGVKIATVENVSSGEHVYTWEVESLPKGAEYYIYIVVKEGSAITKVYSSVPVVIGPKTVKARSKQDFDGDGKSDPAVYRSSTASYFVNSSLNFKSQVFSYGASSFQPIEGDFDGDGISDRAFISEISGALFWYVIRSSDGVLYSRAWGVPGDTPVVGDYNGNGQDEIAIYRAGAWFIFDENDGAHVKYWGVAGIDKPVVGDFDGDGKVDLTIQRGTDGVWWILYSGFSEGFTDNYFLTVQWGLPWAGDRTIATDFSGDGRDDIVVWRPGDGSWYVRDPQTNQFSIVQWGLPGDEPLSRVDRNGDGKFDYAVFRPGLATWFYRTGDKLEAVQYGLANDRIPK